MDSIRLYINVTLNRYSVFHKGETSMVTTYNMYEEYPLEQIWPSTTCNYYSSALTPFHFIRHYQQYKRIHINS